MKSKKCNLIINDENNEDEALLLSKSLSIPCHSLEYIADHLMNPTEVKYETISDHECDINDKLDSKNCSYLSYQMFFLFSNQKVLKQKVILSFFSNF